MIIIRRLPKTSKQKFGMRQNVGSSYFLFDQNQPFEIIVRLRLLSNIIYSIFYLLKDLSSIFTEFVAQNFSNKTKLKIITQ